MTLVVMALHAMPGSELTGQDWWAAQRLDLVLHAVLFGVWGMALLVAFRKGLVGARAWRRAWPWTAALGLFLAALMEGAQASLFPERGADFLDVVADFFGLLCAGFAFRALYLEWPMGKRTL